MFRKGAMWHKADCWNWDYSFGTGSPWLSQLASPCFILTSQLLKPHNCVFHCLFLWIHHIVTSFFCCCLFLYRVSFISSKMRVIPFNALSIATSCILAKIHLVPHKAIFFTKRGLSIGIFFSTAPRAGWQSTRVGLYVCGCLGSTASPAENTFYRLGDGNDWMVTLLH